MDIWINEWKFVFWVDGWIHRWMGVCFGVDRWINGSAKGWKDKWIDDFG